jgi:hypothetical protein
MYRESKLTLSGEVQELHSYFLREGGSNAEEQRTEIVIRRFGAGDGADAFQSKSKGTADDLIPLVAEDAHPALGFGLGISQQIHKRGATTGASGDRVVFLATDRWAKACALVQKGDRVFLSGFKVVTLKEIPQPSPSAKDQRQNTGDSGRAVLLLDEPPTQQEAPTQMFVIGPVLSTRLAILRDRRIELNEKNVGDLDSLDLTQAERKSALLRMRHTLNQWTGLGRYADLLFGSRPQFDLETQFIEATIGMKRNRVLDVGCGSGIHSFALRGGGCYPVLVDSSEMMTEVLKQKNEWFCSLDGRPPLVVVQRDITGHEQGEQLGKFSFLLALRLLNFLPSTGHIRRGMSSMANWMESGAGLLLSVRNVEWLKRQPKMIQRMQATSLESSKLGYGSYHYPSAHGEMHSIIREVAFASGQEAAGFCPQLLQALGGENGAVGIEEDVLRFGTHYYCSAHFCDTSTSPSWLPPSTECADHVVTFEEDTLEIVPPNGFWLNLFDTFQLEVVKVYGDLKGSAFHQTESKEIVYVLRKR